MHSPHTSQVIGLNPDPTLPGKVGTCLKPGHTVATFSGEYARSLSSSLLVANSWSIFTVLHHSPWILI